MSSPSARTSRTRPFCSDHAPAFDLLVTDAVAPWVDAVHDRLAAAGRPRARVLDAGCGTGRHAAALTALGHHVDLADAAPALLEVAAERNPKATTWLADLCDLVVEPTYDAITCRGVLNDMTTELERYDLRPLRGPAGTLTFGTTVTWQDDCLQVLERYDLRPLRGPAQGSEFSFVMRRWTESELRARLSAAGFDHIDVGPGIERATDDRLFVTATAR